MRFSRREHGISRKNIDNDALSVLNRLWEEGHTAYLVGGSVRDLLLGREPKDFDVVTSARPAQVRSLFRNSRLVGRRFRLVHVIYGDKKVEVSTFRKTPQFEDNENEDENSFIPPDNTFGTPEEDARRRDFTINGIFYDIGDYALYDYVGGMEDINDRILRTIGDPGEKFQEDPVRMLRAVKFLAKLDGFTIEKNTDKALLGNVNCIHHSSKQRVQEELWRLLEGGYAQKSFTLLKEKKILAELMPALGEYLRGRKRQETFFKTLALCDRLERGTDRVAIFCLFFLPLLLSKNCLKKKFIEDEIRQTLEPYIEYLGLCKSSQDKLMEVFRVIHWLSIRNCRDGEVRMPKGVASIIRPISNALISLGLAEEDVVLKDRGGCSGQ